MSADIETFYADPAKRLTLCGTTGKALMDKKLPWLVAVPSLILEWAAEMPRPPKEIVDMIGILIHAGRSDPNCPQQPDFVLLIDF